jgi:phage repressor protein C with HTH and peptisase S24 domain
VYYFAGYFQATKSNSEKVSFCVPSGNFGNVCAGGTNFSFDASPANYLPISLPIPQGRRVGAWLVKGDCMDDGSVDAIRQGDTIVVMEQADADSGKIVVAMLNGEITVKQIVRKDGHIELKPKNTKHKPIIVKTGDFKILGVVIYSFRRH